MDNSKLRIEKLAAIQHDIWIHWMEYLFEVSNLNEDGSCAIPKDKVKRWKRQINTHYDDLSEEEKDSDREQAIKVLKVIQ